MTNHVREAAEQCCRKAVERGALTRGVIDDCASIITAAIEAATQDSRAEIERLKEQVAELQDISFDRAEDCAEVRECELCGRGVDDKPHIICGECQSECSQPRKQEPA